MTCFKKISTVHEISLLLTCSRLNLTPDQEARIAGLFERPTNWDFLFQTARHQRVLPLLHHTLKKIRPPGIPQSIWDRFKTFTFKNTAKNLHMLAFLNSLVTLFEKNHIDAVPFKGLMTARDIYGDISLRSFSDIDLFIREKDAEKAARLLCRHGLVPELDLNPGQFEKYRNHEDNLSFFHTQKRIVVELHWELSGIYLHQPLSFEHIENRLADIEISGRPFKTLSPEDLLIYLCIHGTKHEWEYLEQVCVLSELIRTKEIDWQRVDMLSSQWRCRNILLLGLHLVQVIFGTPVPEDMADRIQASRRLPEVATAVLNAMFAKPEQDVPFSRPARLSNTHILMRDTPGDRLRYFFRLIFRPTKKEWASFPVWAPLSFLHYLLRPVRLMAAGLGKKHA